MADTPFTISYKGRQVPVPSLTIAGARIIVTGSFPRIAVVHDEEWMEQAMLPDPLEVLSCIKNGGLKADLYSFSQRVTATEPKYPFFKEWDNAAVIPITTYNDWWHSLPQIARRNVRTAERKGIIVKQVPFDDELIHGITSIYNESPIRLGKPFWHFGKNFETVKRENGTFLDRSEFIGAYFEGKLIGFIKLVYVDRVGSMMQILSMIQHQDKRTTNALLAKAVDICASRGMSHLMYCKYIYGSNDTSMLTDFKKRSGFQRVNFPQYYVPLNPYGSIALAMRLHSGIRGLLPPRILKIALHLRDSYYNVKK